MSDSPAPSAEHRSGVGGACAGVSLVRLTERADFLRAAHAARQGTPGFLLQARRRDAAEGADAVRVGFTCSKKVGNAVHRNRARRRLREVARLVMPAAAQPGWDYVLIGRAEATAARDFALMQDDLRRALARVHAAPPPRPPALPPPAP